MTHFLTHLQNTLQTHWNAPALTDYCGGADYTLGQVAEKMAQLELLMDKMGVEQGDKVALCGKNSANWGVAFLSLMAARRVAVSILPDFTPEDVQNLVNHSDASLFFTGDGLWKQLDVAAMPHLRAAISLDSFALLYAAEPSVEVAYSDWDKAFLSRYPQGFSLKDVDYDVSHLDDLALINYTSGTTSSPKGVMLTYRSLSSNVQAGYEHVKLQPGDQLVSILPMAHMFGLALEFLYETTAGIHIYFLGKTPTPALLLKAFREIRPFMIVTVPLVLEKIFRKSIFPRLKHPAIRLMWHTPLLNRIVINKVKQNFLSSFGGNLRYIMIGGAALNQDVEKCMKKLGLPYVVGYGMTECGPLIAFEDWQEFAPTSCGKAVKRMEVRIDSTDPLSIPGEIQTRGENLMMGYYKNDDATRAAFTEDGWLHTGDLGLVNSKGDIFIKGRSKNMLLGPSGQNIYPEEIEDRLNAMPAVAESIIVDRNGHLIALVYPDPVQLEKRGKHVIERMMSLNIRHLNHGLPMYSQVHGFELRDEEFEKTPKRSIRRFLYS